MEQEREVSVRDDDDNRYGWRLGDFIKISEMKNPEHVRKRVIEVPGLKPHVIKEQELQPTLALTPSL